MNTKTKIITLVLATTLVVAPLFALASVAGTPSTNLLTATANSIQAELNALEQQLASLYQQVLSQSTTSTSTVTLQLGDKSVLVAVLQRTLINGGYMNPPATGIFDASTEAGVKAFQTAKGLPVTGYINIVGSSIPATFEETSIPFVPITVGTTGGQTSNFQAILIKTGDLDIAAPTGYFGTLTQAAVEKFQVAHGLPETGVIDQATFLAMNGK
jgi:peptidoglycan endopeptidase LytE